MTFNLTAYIKSQNELINRYLETAIPENLRDQRIVAAMKYSLMAKRILVMAARYNCLTVTGLTLV